MSLCLLNYDIFIGSEAKLTDNYEEETSASPIYYKTSICHVLPFVIRRSSCLGHRDAREYNQAIASQ